MALRKSVRFLLVLLLISSVAAVITVDTYYQWDSSNATVDFGVWTEGFVSINWNLTNSSAVNTSTCWIRARNKDYVTNYTNLSYIDDDNHPDYDLATGYKNLTCYTEDLGGGIMRVSANFTRSYDWRPLNTAFEQDNASRDNEYKNFGEKSTKMVFHNITSLVNATYIFLADVDNQTDTVADFLFYTGNVSYTTGDFTTEPTCALVGAVTTNATRDTNFGYIIGALTTDENGTFGGVRFTTTMYGMSYCPSCTNTNNAWITYSTNVYDGHSATSSNLGGTWNDLSGEEFNVILHVIDNTQLEFNLTIEDNLSNILTDLQYDIYGELPNAAPFGDIQSDNVTGGLVSYYDIHGVEERGTIWVNTTVSDPNADNISCSVYLLNNDSSINKTLLANYSICCGYGTVPYEWDTTTVDDGDYRLNVTCTDGLLTGYDESSGYIRVSNPPVITYVSPTEANDTTVYVDYTIVNATIDDSEIDEIAMYRNYIEEDSSLVGYWKFDNSSTENNTHVYDWSGNGNNGTATSLTYGSGKIDNAGVFDGSSSYVDCGNDASLNIIDALTMSYWLYLNELPSDNGNDFYITKKGLAWGAYVGQANNKVYFYGLNLSDKWIGGGASQTALEANKWYHIAVTYDKINAKIYLNGVEDYTQAESNSLSTDANIFAIGRDGHVSQAYFNGSIDSVRIYNKSLTPYQIKELYYSTKPVYMDDRTVLKLDFNNLSAIGDNSTFFRDVSEYGNNGTCVGATCPSYVSGKYGLALDFDGSNDYVDCGNDDSLNITDIITVEAWVNANVIANKGIVTKDSAIAGGRQYNLRADANVFSWRIWQSDGTAKERTISATPNTWTHIVGVADGTNIILYKNGIAGTALSYDGTIKNTSTDVEIGRYSGNCLNGSIDAVEITNYAKSTDEVWHSYQANLHKYNSSQWRLEVNMSNLTDGEYTHKVVGNDTSGNEGSNIRYFSIDDLPSTPVLSSPTDNDHTSDTTPTFDWADCTDPDVYSIDAYELWIANDTGFTITEQNTTDINVSTHTLVLALSDGVYYWKVRCNNSQGTYSEWSSYYTVVIDTVYPDWIEGNMPAFDNSSIVGGNSVLFDVKVYDIYIYNVLINITNSSGDVLHTNSTTDWNDTWFNYTETVDMSSWNDGVHTIELSATDDHCNTSKHNLTYKIQPNHIEFKGSDVKKKKVYAGYYDDGQIHIMNPTQINNYNVTFTVDTYEDKYKYSMTFNKPVVDMNFGFVIPVEKVKKRRSVGHFVWEDWYMDFDDMPLSGFPTTMYSDKHHYIVYSSTSYCTESVCTYDPVVGGLNTRTEYYEFTVDNTAPVVTIVEPVATAYTVDNYSYVNVTDTDTHNTSAFIDWNNSLVGWWRFNNETDFTDYSSYSNDGTNSGSSYVSNGRLGGARSFDGVSNYIDCGNDTSVDITGNMTISAWAKTYSSGSAGIYAGIVTKKENNLYTGNGYALILNWANKWDFHMGNGTHTQSISSAATINQWTHVVGIVNDTHVKLYIDSVESSQVKTLSPNSITNSLEIGRWSGQETFNGTIDDVLIFNRALSEYEIKAIYNSQANSVYRNFTDLAEGGYSITAYSQDLAGNVGSGTSQVYIDPSGTALCTTHTSDIYLYSDFTVGGDCITIGADSIGVYGNEHTLTGNRSGTGISCTNYNSVTIDNLTVEKFNYNVYLNNVSTPTFSDTSLIDFHAYGTSPVAVDLPETNCRYGFRNAKITDADWTNCNFNITIPSNRVVRVESYEAKGMPTYIIIGFGSGGLSYLLYLFRRRRRGR